MMNPEEADGDDGRQLVEIYFLSVVLGRRDDVAFPVVSGRRLLFVLAGRVPAAGVVRELVVVLVRCAVFFTVVSDCFRAVAEDR